MEISIFITNFATSIRILLIFNATLGYMKFMIWQIWSVIFCSEKNINIKCCKRINYERE